MIARQAEYIEVLGDSPRMPCRKLLDVTPRPDALADLDAGGLHDELHPTAFYVHGGDLHPARRGFCARPAQLHAAMHPYATLF